MFFRTKRTKDYQYLQIVESIWENGRSKQKIICTLGRIDELQRTGKLDALIASGARFAAQTMVLSAHRDGQTTELGKRHVGGPLVFERLWLETGCSETISALVRDRKFGFDLERAIFATVLHRLMRSGSDRACEKWLSRQQLRGAESMQLQHLYRAMGWLGEELPEAEQDDSITFSPRCTKDVIEEQLFSRRRDLFTTLDMVFFDTTSIYFEGSGGETLGQHGHSKDHRPDLKQMVVGASLDSDGHPLCCELWPGNAADVKSLEPVVRRMKNRFKIDKLCVVADRGMISKETLAFLEQQGYPYILGARMRRQLEVSDDVLARAGRYKVVHPGRTKSDDPSPLKVKEVWVGEHRYVVCENDEQAKKDQADRDAILAGLEKALKQGDKSLIGNKGYRKFLVKAKHGSAFAVDKKKVEAEARYDGKWVLRTNMDLPAETIALKYKQLWMVEDLFRTTKSILETRPVYHKMDETIRGHVFCSFLALVLRKELMDRIAGKGFDLGWHDVIEDLDGLEEIHIAQDGKEFLLRAGATGCCGKVFQAAGVALPPTLHQIK